MKQRFYSLDIFRGATVALMILVNNPGSWAHIYAPLEHAPWHGCTPTDLVFPFFLFAVGNALAFVMPRLQEQGQSVFLKKVFRRALLIFSIGLFLNWSPFVGWQGDHLVFRSWVNQDNPVNGIRLLGVLQRIALCYLFASLIIYYCRPRGAFVVAAILLLGYWMLSLFSNPADPYSIQGWFGTAIDKKILGVAHMYKGEGFAFDPEGLMSTLPAITEVIFGYLAGIYIIQKGKSFEGTTVLFATAGLLVLTGYCWHMVFPINKKIWTSSYVLYTSGLALFWLALLIYLVELRSFKSGIFKFFDAFGENPLFIFFLSGFLPRLLALFRWVDHYDAQGKPVYTSSFPWLYEHIFKNLSIKPENGSVAYAIFMVCFYWLIAWWMNRRKIYIKV